MVCKRLSFDPETIYIPSLLSDVARFLVSYIERVDLIYFGILEESLSPGMLGHKIFWKIKLKGAERISIPDAFLCRLSCDHLLILTPSKGHTSS